MRTRTLARSAAGLALAVVAVTGMAGCSSTSSSTPEAAASAVNISGTPVDAKDDLTALCKQIVDQKLTKDAADALAEANGYVTRVTKLDGADQAATTDLNETRLNFEITADVVTGCTVG